MTKEVSKAYASRVLTVLCASATARQWEALVDIIETAGRENAMEAKAHQSALLNLIGDVEAYLRHFGAGAPKSHELCGRCADVADKFKRE